MMYFTQRQIFTLKYQSKKQELVTVKQTINLVCKINSGKKKKEDLVI